MDADQVTDMFGIMALAAAVFVVGAVLAGLHAPARAWLRRELDRYGASSAWLVALVATGGSLWFSEVADFPPCELCWYQRVAMYPLVVVLGARAFGAETRGLRGAALGLLVPGLLVNVWHVTIETDPRPVHGGLRRRRAVHGPLGRGPRVLHDPPPCIRRVRPDRIGRAARPHRPAPPSLQRSEPR